MTDPSTVILAARDLAVRYGDRDALTGFAIELRPGRLTGMIGPDGAGKSTAIRTLCGLVKPHCGGIAIEGEHVERPRKRVTRLVGYMPQHFSLYTDLTIDENITFYARLHSTKVSRSRHDALLEKMGLGSFGSRLAGRLSGGMKQKLALLCVLVHEPRLIIMDEPTTGVDPASRREFWKILGELAAQGMSILVATPYLDEAERCHEVLLMHEGRTILRGEPDILVSNLGRPIFRIRSDDSFATREKLGKLEWVRTVQVFGSKLHLTCEDPADGSQAVEERLRALGIDAPARQAFPTLEDVFIDAVMQ